MFEWLGGAILCMGIIGFPIVIILAAIGHGIQQKREFEAHSYLANKYKEEQRKKKEEEKKKKEKENS